MRDGLLVLTVFAVSAALVGTGCGDDVAKTGAALSPPSTPAHEDVYAFADGCYAVHALGSKRREQGYLAATADGAAFEFSADRRKEASSFYMKASGLGKYIFYDSDERYVVGRKNRFERKAEITSSLMKLDDDYKPGVQWKLEAIEDEESRYRLKNLRTGGYLTLGGASGGVEDAATVSLLPADGCAQYPELTVDATGEVRSKKWPDGSVWGFADIHTHLMSNFGFGGAGIFHGAPFHPLGVQHALPSCEKFHGKQGRRDLFGYGFQEGDELSQSQLIQALVEGKTPKPYHATAGYPHFTDWPSAHDSPTHQTQYYKWLRRAHKGGLRLIVQLATSNEVICELLKGRGIQPTRYSCNDMVAVDRILKETRQMERYIDAQAGGPGEGWFRIVESPQEAREVINDGKLAVVLGIEVSNLFDCFLNPPEGKERCDRQDVVQRLEKYRNRGVRTIFPVHKYDNGFSAGDGHRGIIELGNFAQTGHYSNFTTDCPDVPAKFDQGDVQFGDLNEPRDDYFAPPPVDVSTFDEEPINTLLGVSGRLTGGPLEGDYCMNHGLTSLGEFLIRELMKRGMLIEVDHLPQRSYKRTFEILQKYDYPAVGSHGTNYNGKIYELGGASKFNFRTCGDPDEPSHRVEPLQKRIRMRKKAGAYPGEGFGFDLNGFAGAPGPRFGKNSVCERPQDNPVEYPFKSYSGNVTFTQPQLGKRTPDFNTEGLVHVGMIPELIQDVQNTGVTKEQLEPLFRSAEAYLRTWEKAERRAEALKDELE